MRPMALANAMTVLGPLPYELPETRRAGRAAGRAGGDDRDLQDRAAAPTQSARLHRRLWRLLAHLRGPRSCAPRAAPRISCAGRARPTLAVAGGSCSAPLAARRRDCHAADPGASVGD